LDSVFDVKRNRHACGQHGRSQAGHSLDQVRHLRVQAAHLAPHLLQRALDLDGARIGLALHQVQVVEVEPRLDRRAPGAQRARRVRHDEPGLLQCLAQ